VSVRATDPDDARRRKLLSILLGGIGGLIALTLIVTGLLATTVVEGYSEPLSLAFRGGGAALAGIVLVYVVNRYCSGTAASSLFLLLLTLIFALSDEPRQVVEGRSVFLFTIPIFMASVVLRPWASFVMAGVSGLVVTPIALGVNIVPPLPTMLGFFAVALVSWLSALNLENTLRDLRALNRELDRRVEDRTKELREANRRLARANERLMELDRLKSRFVSMVSHELRTPLGVVQGFAEMLSAGIYGSLSDKQEDALARIQTNTKALLNIVNDLLDQARIEAGQLSLHSAPFNPAELADDLHSTMGVLARREGLKLTTFIDNDLPDTLYGDKERLNQILLNLVSNAIKFTEQGGIQVRMYLPDGPHSSHWAIKVVDTGPGIPVEDKESIFLPFGRVDDSMTRQHTGVGLGLSIVKQLVELMNGEITLESELGRGCTFTIVLPLRQQHT
jgi:signal transduction histidine kinase